MEREAMYTAKEALVAHPHNPRVLTLVGLALAGAAEGSNNRSSSKRGGGVEGGSTTRKKAKRALQKALSIDPDAARPLLALVNVHCAEHEYVEAADLVRSSLEGTASSSFRGYSAVYGASGSGGGGGKTKITEMGSDIAERDLLLAKLADILALNGNYSEALSCYHKALSENPENVKATNGLDRLERSMRGE